MPKQQRDPFIDTVRVVAVSIVVVGHWLTTSVFRDGDALAWENALSVIPAAHPVTWLLQVMPLLFFVGGFANARSLARHEGDYLAFLRTRLVRLMRPTVVFIAVWVVLSVVADAAGWTEVELAADVAALPFWFLGLYVAVIALAPAMVRLDRRHGWRVVAALVVGAAVVDVVVHGAGVEEVGVLNYAFVWLLPHQLGIIHAGGGWERVRGRVAAATAAIGLAGLVVLVTAANYPVSMIGVPGEERWNTDPPSLALVALTVWLIGLALMARPMIVTPAVPRAVTALNRVALTLYLWHVTVIAVGAAVLVALGVPDQPTGSTAWWATRPVWLVVLAVIMVPVVRLFRRFEIHPAPQEAPTDRRPVRTAAATLGVVSLALALLGFGVTGFDQLATDRGESVLGFAMNPLLGVLQLLLGLVLARAAYGLQPRAAGLAGAAVYALLGALGWSSGITVLGTNPAMARVHLVVGVVGLAVVAGLRSRPVEVLESP